MEYHKGFERCSPENWQLHKLHMFIIPRAPFLTSIFEGQGHPKNKA